MYVVIVYDDGAGDVGGGKYRVIIVKQSGGVCTFFPPSVHAKKISGVCISLSVPLTFGTGPLTVKRCRATTGEYHPCLQYCHILSLKPIMPKQEKARRKHRIAAVISHHMYRVYNQSVIWSTRNWPICQAHFRIQYY